MSEERINKLSDKETSEKTNKKSVQTKKISNYREGDKYKNKIIKRLYFSNSEKKFMIFKTEDDIVRACGANFEHITHQLAESKYLTEQVKDKKAKEWYDYQRATAMNTYLIGQQEKSKDILRDLIYKLQQRQIVQKKIWYIGIFLGITIIMFLVSIIFSSFGMNFYYTKYIKIATFGAIGGFISLNIKLSDMKFEVSESTWSYIIVSIYKVVFSMLTAIISYFLIESDIILSVLKNDSTDNMYLVYTVATLAGFSESLLPNIFKSIEGNATTLEEKTLVEENILSSSE